MQLQPKSHHFLIQPFQYLTMSMFTHGLKHILFYKCIINTVIVPFPSRSVRSICGIMFVINVFLGRNYRIITNMLMKTILIFPCCCCGVIDRLADVSYVRHGLYAVSYTYFRGRKCNNVIVNCMHSSMQVCNQLVNWYYKTYIQKY